ncbi:hypothetical protein D8674_002281 [Pyrus ussuriensis x Pyrus communis]|uniref:Uncharacterized protein n=1 Tax=Pyrus ussuriensis x Pyrus communis TaxID=2448454 RepID=A0A5N5FDU9_9ROSA|nr:hypothetical protein D8674_002281 [Pyrus ussuriensis x Pyrus communis]
MVRDSSTSHFPYQPTWPYLIIDSSTFPPPSPSLLFLGLYEVHRTKSGIDHHRCVSFSMSCQMKSLSKGYSTLQA